MGDLVSKSFVKGRWPDWETFLDDGNEEPDNVLDRIIEDGEARLLEYVSVDDELSPQLRLHLMAIIKKFGFDIKHGNSSFEHTPAIVQDYEDTIETLEAYREGRIGSEGLDEDDFHVSGKKRKFDTWFTDPDIL